MLVWHISNPESPRAEEVRKLVSELALEQGKLEAENRELRKTQQQLEAYRDRYVDLYDFAPVGYVTLDEDAYVQEINLAGVRLLGGEREELTGYPFTPHVVERDRAAFAEHLRVCCAERCEVTSELSLIGTDQRSIAVQLRSVPIEAGEPEGIFCKTAITDISQRKRAEETLRESEERLRLVLESSGTGWWLLDLVTGALTADERSKELFGLPASAEPSFALFLERTVAEDRELARRHLAEASVHPGDYRGEYRTIWPDGSLHWILIKGRAFHDTPGKPRCLMGVTIDVTQRKQAEEALQHERNLLRTLIDHLPDCVYVKDAESRFVAANVAVARIMGAAAPDDVVGKTDDDFYPAELAAQYRKDEQELVRTGQPMIEKEEPHRDPAGNARAVLTTKIPLKDRQGKVVGLVGVSRDITDHKRAEQELQRAKELAEEANRTKSQFLAVTSHELRSPMNVILGMTELALEEVLPAEARDCLETVKDSADSVLALLNDMIDLSRIEAGKLVFESVPFSLRRMVGETARLMQVRANEKGLTLDAEVAAATPDWVRGDPLRLRQILLNLLSNAIKFTEEGKIVVRLDVAEQAADAAAIRFSVADTGVGIEAAVRQKIFAPFFQAATAATPSKGGTGLGLTIATNLVAMMGGRIELETAPGQGSTFYFTLRFPTALEPSPPAIEEHTAHTVSGGKIAMANALRVLLVEDTPASQILVIRVLNKRGHAVATAENGRQALEMLRQQNFDLVLMDVQMPVMDGFEAAAAIRAMSETRKSRVPVIAITAHAMKGDRERCLAAGMDGYIAKPIHGGKLIELVERLAVDASR